jgi:hypothetical protein
MRKVSAAVVSAAALALSVVGAGAAHADGTGPAFKFFQAPIPTVGSVLSDSSGSPYVTEKDGWAVNDGDGICSPTYMNLYDGDTGTTTQVWNAPSTGRTVTSLINNAYTGAFHVNGYSEFEGHATDCLGNTSSAYDYIDPTLAQQGAASYGAGWSTSQGAVFSGGSVMYSTKVGATATYTGYGPLISLVSEQASNRGKVSISVDGQPATTVTLTKSATKNRVIVWNSKYLSTSGTHLVTLKVVSGRVDIDGFLQQS